MCVIVKMTNKDVDIKMFTIKTHDIKDDEFDKNEINNVISNSKSMLLLGELPGVGAKNNNSMHVIMYVKRNYLYVARLYNKLQELRKKGIDSITLNI
jgi:hypothetical protein